MEYYDKEFTLEVWGPMACFTRPELKVERVSYDVITPSAARAIFEAIFWKPAIRWQVTKIEVLNPIKWTSVRRNEVGAVASKSPIYIDELKEVNGKPKLVNRQQKNTLMLRDVRYRITAKLMFIPQKKRQKAGVQLSLFDNIEHNNENPAKYNAMFERRAAKGQCFNQPYLGTRECVASFRLVNTETDQLEPPIQESRDLGIMLYDMDFEGNPTKPDAMFFRAKMENGIIVVPLRDCEEVLR